MLEWVAGLGGFKIFLLIGGVPILFILVTLMIVLRVKITPSRLWTGFKSLYIFSKTLLILLGVSCWGMILYTVDYIRNLFHKTDEPKQQIDIINETGIPLTVHAILVQTIDYATQKIIAINTEQLPSHYQEAAQATKNAAGNVKDMVNLSFGIHLIGCLSFTYAQNKAKKHINQIIGKKVL